MTRFEEISAEAPNYDWVSSQYELIEADLAGHIETIFSAILRWDTLRRDLDTWSALTHLRFNQDTRNEEYKRARDYCDALGPKLTELAVGFKRRLLSHSRRQELESRFGSQAFAIWENDILTFDPVIEQDLVQEAKLCARYTEILASAKIEFQGEFFTLSEIVKFREQPNRELRKGAELARWRWFESHADELDTLFGELVSLRHAMARKLGYETFIPLGYRKMSRIGYGEGEVQRFRNAVRAQVVPLAAQLRARQLERLSLDDLMFWDEGVFDRKGNPAPKGDHDWLLARALEMFDEIAPEMGDFFRSMVDGHFLDLRSRDGKAGGGFCTSFPSRGMPFIFANFNGTKGDVEIFSHEMGHAFQCYMSREHLLSEYLWPTTEACEIHSMSLEFLTYPYMEKFFGEDAERFRQIHLEQAILFLPYGVAVDHFQHLVYARPEASAAERRSMWREVESLYLPWRKYGDLPHLGTGGLFHFQRHIFTFPFYYIDYTLAQTGALQFWVRSEQDRCAAVKSYVDLCRRGGIAPFEELCRGAGLESPFQSGALEKIVERAKATLCA